MNGGGPAAVRSCFIRVMIDVDTVCLVVSQEG